MTRDKQFARAKAIAVLERMAIDLTGSLAGLKEPNPMTDVLNQRLDAIDVAQEALREQPRWIGAEERLPEETLVGKYILVCIKNRWNEQRVDTVHWWGPERMHEGAWFWSDITHWMPLPEPPEVEV